jgi:uncharacterized membrane protein YGL010W
MPNMDFEQALKEYKSQHQTVGCIVTHMFGVPMIALSLPLALINFRKSLSCFVVGWILQFIGHYCFEKNKPVLLTKSGNIWVPLAALFMAGQYWRAALTGNISIGRKNGKAKLFLHR